MLDFRQGRRNKLRGLRWQVARPLVATVRDPLSSRTTYESQEDRDPRSAGCHWSAYRVGLARFRIFLLRFLLPELDQRHHRYHRFLRSEAGVPAVRPKELRPREADAAGH